MLKKISLLTISALTAISYSQLGQARGFDLKLADEMAELNYMTETATFGYGGTDVGVGVYFNEADDVQFQGKVMVTGNPAGNNKALQYGIGGKLLFTTFDVIDEEVGALAVGGQLRYVIPATTPVAFKLEGYYAPSITSFSGADEFSEFSFAVELEVTPSARAYVGYRHMEYEFENGGEYELDDDVHVGIKFDF